MTTSDERREVADRLRFCARETNWTRDFAMFLNHWIGVCNESVGGQFSVKSDRRTAEMTLEKLADLIDPTCHDISSKDFEFMCSSCNAYTDKPGQHGSEIGYVEDYGENLRYCPNCGARVVIERTRSHTS